jgi:hypothetical protein
VSCEKPHFEPIETLTAPSSGAERRLAFTMRAELSMFFGTLLSLTLAANAPSAASVGEQKLKSAFLYNFTKFIEWPPERFADPNDPIVIGLLADTSMLTEVSSIIENRQVNGRPLAVRLIDDAADLRATHLVFVASHEQSRYVSLRKSFDETAALVVGDSVDCALHDIGICFVQQGEKLRFEVHIDAAERAHVKISAQLQKLAVAVHRGT